MGLLPTWGDKWHSRQDQPGPRVFDADNAEAYARFVGERYRDRAVIFILGGDRNPETDEDFAIVRAMARGLKATAPRNLVTYHPRGPGRSSDFFHDEDWLDFNMIQSSHTGRGSDNGVHVTHDRALEPAKPTLDGEPRYEAIIVDFYMEGANPALRFDAADARMAAYRPLLAGAAGHTYGNNNVWQMWSPGARAGHLGRHALARGPRPPGGLPDGAPAPAVRVAAVGEAGPRAGIHPEREPRGRRLHPGRGGLGPAPSPSCTRPRARPSSWTRAVSARPSSRTGGSTPATAAPTPIHTGTGTATQAFTPPSSGPGRDWVLVIDDPQEGLPAPGAAPGRSE